jgi:hypothetical protein
MRACGRRIKEATPALSVPLMGWNITLRGAEFAPNMNCSINGASVLCYRASSEEVVVPMPPAAEDGYATLVRP